MVVKDDDLLLAQSGTQFSKKKQRKQQTFKQKNTLNKSPKIDHLK